METIKKKGNGRINLFISSMIVLLGVAIIGCSSDDDPNINGSINAQAQTFTVNGINNCNTSIGDGSTLVFEIPYTTSDGINITKLLIKSTVSDGGTQDAVNTQFSNTNNVIGWVSCFTFGSQDWVEYGVRLEASDGSISNTSTVRVNKPNGAN